MIDELIGKLLDLRGPLSTELALQAGEATGAPENIVKDAKGAAALEKAGKAGEGYQTAKQAENWAKFMDFFTGGAYSKNAQSNADRTAASGYADQVTGGARAMYAPQVPQQQFNAVTGQIEVRVTDERVATRVTSRGPVPLRTGRATPGGAR